MRAARHTRPEPEYSLPMLRGLRARQVRAAVRVEEPRTYRRPTLTAEDIYARHAGSARIVPMPAAKEEGE